jgi:hypothetical protein
MKRMRLQDWISVALGVWLVVSPWALGFSDNGAATWNALFFGLGIVALEFADVYFPDPWPERVSVFIGLWVAISPMVLGFTDVTAAMVSTVITGVLVVVLSLWTWIEVRQSAASH